MSNNTQGKINKEQAKLYRLESHLAKQKLKARASRTRQLIEQGGLVSKAQLNELPKDILLGALIHIRELLDHEPEHEHLFQAKGKAAFIEKKENSQQ